MCTCIRHSQNKQTSRAICQHVQPNVRQTHCSFKEPRHKQEVGRHSVRQNPKTADTRHVCIFTYIHTYMYTYTCIHLHVWSGHVYMYGQDMHTCMVRSCKSTWHICQFQAQGVLPRCGHAHVDVWLWILCLARCKRSSAVCQIRAVERLCLSRQTPTQSASTHHMTPAH